MAKHLNAKGKGVVSYDYKEDTLFFKTKDREYQKSIEFDDIVVDIDKEGYITGIQLFGASKLFNLNKIALRDVKGWEFHTKAQGNVITINLIFNVKRRNKSIESHQSLVRETESKIANSEVECTIQA